MVRLYGHVPAHNIYGIFVDRKINITLINLVQITDSFDIHLYPPEEKINFESLSSFQKKVVQQIVGSIFRIYRNDMPLDLLDAARKLTIISGSYTDSDFQSVLQGKYKVVFFYFCLT